MAAILRAPEDLGAKLAADVTFARGGRHEFTLKAGAVLADWEPFGAGTDRVIVRFAGHTAVVGYGDLVRVVWDHASRAWVEEV